MSTVTLTSTFYRHNIEDYERFLIVEAIRPVTEAFLIEKLEAIFATHGFSNRYDQDTKYIIDCWVVDFEEMVFYRMQYSGIKRGGVILVTTSGTYRVSNFIHPADIKDYMVKYRGKIAGKRFSL